MIMSLEEDYLLPLFRGSKWRYILWIKIYITFTGQYKLDYFHIVTQCKLKKEQYCLLTELTPAAKWV